MVYGRIASRAAAVAIASGPVFYGERHGDGQWRRKLADCCGIVGVVANDDASKYLLDGLMILRNRGYDSAGIATLATGAAPGEGQILVTKYASRGSTADSIELVRQHAAKHAGHNIGIAHTRWATHGGKTDENAHPHFDAHCRVAVVHNGVITNADFLRKEMESTKNIIFRSQTDTEVIAQLIGCVMDDRPDLHLREATSKALARCEGTWGLAVLSTSNAAEVVVACNGSPMTIGLAADKTFIASEPAAYNQHTKNFIAMQDGEIGVVRAGDTSLDLTRVEQAPELDLRPSPAPHAHWMEREIKEQPEAIARALAYGGRLGEDKVFLGGLDRNKDKMRQVEHLLLVGCGTSLNASRYGAKLMRDLGAFTTATAMDAAELDVTDLPRSSAGMLAVSQSGETKDVQRCVKAAEGAGVTAISIVNNVGSLIARTTKCGVYLNAGRENAVASTKAFTTQVTVMALITCWFRQLRDEDEHHESFKTKARDLMDSLQRLPISFGMALRLQPQCKRLAEKLKGADHIFILGKGYGEPIAQEGALKIKECTYIHAEAFSGGAMKHGPFALISEDMTKRTPIIMLILDDEHAHHMRTAACEVKARNADVMIITDDRRLAQGLDDDPIVIPRNGRLTALIAVLPLQFLAYELGLLRGVDPDFPRHLAKSVTVD
ncbi:hypothetical protein M885DRAFT_459226 [Pelagophyceae sp. CCMP2097]|nr:hypothetical protein M885DRAFT_459226 [Pelagophyceae sp. CCMP2097]|mmetsp:Transcript_21032/g.72506  ORF Transcript_21032/g.72506 Transcript_21032/m.72506 type:complete len:663 (+) Transcript_21032:60-2048(+)